MDNDKYCKAGELRISAIGRRFKTIRKTQD